MNTIHILRTEHEAILMVLEQLERAASAAAQGIPVPASIFSDIQEFFSVFVDRCHHGKEESEVFPRLVSSEEAALIARLEAEHTTGRQQAERYAAAVRTYVPGDALLGAQLAQAAGAYAAFLREHIDRETHELFPAIERSLAPQDQTLVEAFERIEEERIGPGTHERLHRMIDGLAGRIASVSASAPTQQ